ncbi:hypothetical protein [Thiothrix winogradskyi]|jgi:hypothetical protein|uniref:Uncharacterized protein n=1 Tax=Thiothrix winogradskyi TaxID=96472 RepID=A0ABY3SX01_9GAMM|nr:hypothetical protein [Thiothrix winogradskyi]UJS22965.1 hypothetical protein L2Y54_13550 [Thiothrix winogradskyi]
MVREVYQPPTVTEAKQQLRTAFANTEYFGFIKKHPLESAGASLLAGILFGRFNKGQLSPGLLGLAAQLLKRV